MSELTRKQVEIELQLLVKCPADQVRADSLKAYDAALRAKVEELETELDIEKHIHIKASQDHADAIAKVEELEATLEQYRTTDANNNLLLGRVKALEREREASWINHEQIWQDKFREMESLTHTLVEALKAAKDFLLVYAGPPTDNEAYALYDALITQCEQALAQAEAQGVK